MTKARLADLLLPQGRPTRLRLAGILLAGLGLRLWVLWAYPSFYADEAVTALMAKHIAEGRDFPACYYGQAYFGALEAYLTAPLAWVFGWHWRLILVWPVLSSLALALGAFLLGRRLATPRAGLLAAALVALPGAAVTRVMVTGGAFSFAAALELTVLVWLLCRPPLQTRAWFAFGLLGGITGWVWQLWWLMLPLVALVAWRWRRPKRRASWLGAAGLLLGAAPLIGQNLLDPFSTWWSLAPRLGIFRGTPPDRWAASSQAALQQPGVDFRLESLAGLAGNNPVLLAAGLLALAWWGWRLLTGRERRPEVRLPAGLLLAAFCLTWLPGLSAQRYLLVPAAILAAALAAALTLTLPARLQLAGLAVLLGLNLLTYRGPALQPWETPAYFESAAAALEARGLRRGWSDYWSAYPIVALTAERVILAPTLVSDDGVLLDRYPAYRTTVESADATVCLVLPGSPDYPFIQAAAARGDCSPLQPLDNWWLTTCRGGAGVCGIAGR